MSNHCDCHCDHDHEAQHGHNHINRYEEAFALFDLHLHDENVTAAVRRLIDEKSTAPTRSSANSSPPSN